MSRAVCETQPLALGSRPCCCSGAGPSHTGSLGDAEPRVQLPSHRAWLLYHLGGQHPSRFPAGTRPLAPTLPGAPGSPALLLLPASAPAPKPAFTLILLTASHRPPPAARDRQRQGSRSPHRTCHSPRPADATLGSEAQRMGPPCSAGAGTAAAPGAAKPLTRLEQMLPNLLTQG